MKKGSKIAAALVTVMAGSMIYSAQPADAKGILSRLGLKIDEINITLKNKNSTSNNNNSDYRPAPPAPHRPEPRRAVHREPPPPPHADYRREPPPPPHWGR